MLGSLFSELQLLNLKLTNKNAKIQTVANALGLWM